MVADSRWIGGWTQERDFAAEDRIAALEATGLMQQGVILELEDVMARAIAEVEAEGMRAAA